MRLRRLRDPLQRGARGRAPMPGGPRLRRECEERGSSHLRRMLRRRRPSSASGVWRPAHVLRLTHRLTWWVPPDPSRRVPFSRVPMPRQSPDWARRALQARPNKGTETHRDALEWVRIGGLLLTKARTGYSPFVVAGLDLMLSKGLLQATPGLTAYVWEASVQDFVEGTVCLQRVA